MIPMTPTMAMKLAKTANSSLEKVRDRIGAIMKGINWLIVLPDNMVRKFRK
jgi:hypothetical protein